MAASQSPRLSGRRSPCVARRRAQNPHGRARPMRPHDPNAEHAARPELRAAGPIFEREAHPINRSNPSTSNVIRAAEAKKGRAPTPESRERKPPATRDGPPLQQPARRRLFEIVNRLTCMSRRPKNKKKAKRTAKGARKGLAFGGPFGLVLSFVSFRCLFHTERTDGRPKQPPPGPARKAPLLCFGLFWS